MFKIVLSIFIVLILSSCSGGGGTSVEQTPLKTLYFIDAPVEGIDYSCGKRKGSTETKEVNGTIRGGVLQCRKGTITFALGSLILGSIERYKDGQEIRPQDLAHVPQDQIENENVLKMALLIQSLDENEEDDSIVISTESKSKINIESLTQFSVEEVKEIIVHLGKTPVELNEVKRHLIRYSSISYEDSKPTISPFQAEISTSSPAGFVIGTLSINEGKSPLTSLVLSGEGADNFQLNSDGTILLLKRREEEKEYNLEIKAENIYGSVTQTVKLNFKIMDKVGIAQLKNSLIGATVKIIKLNQSNNKEELLFTEKTSSTGTFNSHAKELEESSFYIFEVTGGTEEETTTQNRGALRLITKGEWIKNTNGIIRITPLSEMQYDYVAKYIKDVESFDYNKIETIVNESSRILLDKDLTGDETIDRKDILAFNPKIHQNSLYRTLKSNNSFPKITNQIRDNNMSYVKELFFSCILKTFENTDSFKIEGSFAYAYGDNHFYIYDIFNQKKVSEIYLPKTYDDWFFESFSFYNIDLRVKIYLETNNNHVYLSSLDANIISIDIKDINNPKVDNSYLVGAGKNIIKKNNNILFLSEGIPSFYEQEKIVFTYENSVAIVGEGMPTTSDGKVKYTIGKAKALNITNSNSPIFIDNPTIPYFDKIINYQNQLRGYIIDYANCITDNEYDIFTYNLTDIETDKNLTTQTVFKIESCNSWHYFDELGYFYTSGFDTLELNIYKFLESKYHLGTLKTWKDYRFNEVLNRYGQTLYLGGFNEDSYFLVYFINILEPERTYISNKIYMGRVDPSSFNFYDTIFRTQKDIIDINSFIYASPYITSEEALDRKNKLDLYLFERFSIN